MSSDQKIVFTKDNLDQYLKALGKVFRKMNGTSVPVEIILVGGAAILVNYDFREMTTDVDAVIYASSSMKDAINQVGDTYGLPNGWLNSDFTKTLSYSPKLDEVSVYYRTFSNVLKIRTVSSEYLIAMKLRSGRRYKNDLSDIVGIMSEHKKKGIALTKENISDAVVKLYGSWNNIPENSRNFVDHLFMETDYEKVYKDTVADEQLAKASLIDFENNYPGATNESNVNDILASLKAKKPESHS